MDSLMWSFSQEYNVKQQPSFKNFKTKVVKGGFQSDWKATPNDSTAILSTKRKDGKNQQNIFINNTMSSSACSPSNNNNNITKPFVFETKPLITKKNSKQAKINSNQLPLQIPKSNISNYVQLTCPNAPPPPAHCFQQFNMLVSSPKFTQVDFSPTNLSSLSQSSCSTPLSSQSPTDFDSSSVQNSPKLASENKEETCLYSNTCIQKIEKSNKMKKHNRTAISIRELLN